jgi:hypothetical protein
MARHRIDKSGWQNEADAEDIDAYASRTVNSEGSRAYNLAYERARALLVQKQSAAEIYTALIREPDEPSPINTAKFRVFWKSCG